MITKDFETSQGTVTLRGLKRGEIKRLRAQGNNFGEAVSLEKMEEHTEAVLRMVLPEKFMDKFDDLEEREILLMHLELLRMTYPSDDQIKNSG